MVLVSDDGHSLPLAELRRRAYATTANGLQIDTVEQGWVVAGTVLRIRQDWIIVFSLFGVAAIALSTGLVMTGDTIAASHDTTPLAVLTERRRWILVLAAWRTAVPLTGAGVAGALAYLLLSSGMYDHGAGMTASIPLAVVSVAFCALFGTVMALWSAVHITRQVQSWRPGM